MPKVDFTESQTVEFKRNFSSGDRWLEQGASFVNTDGGEIYFGIEDDGEVVGVSVPIHKADNMQQSFSNLDEPITICCEEQKYFNKTVFVVKIPKGHKIPHFLSGAVQFKIQFNSFVIYDNVAHVFVMYQNHQILDRIIYITLFSMNHNCIQ